MKTDLNNRGKYLVVGGTVRSKYDYEEHFVSAHRLVELYKLNPADCLLIDSRQPHPELEHVGFERVFYPDPTGKYNFNPQTK